MSILERVVRLCIKAFVRSPVTQDIITDYLDLDTPDYRGAFQAWKNARFWRRR